MNTGVDVRVLIDKEYSGVSWHTLDLLRAILSLDEKNKYFFYYNSFKNQSSCLLEFNQANVKIVLTKFPNKLFNYFLQKIFQWPKLDKAVFDFCKEGPDVFWSPHINFSSFSNACKKILTIHDLSFLLYPEFFSFRKNFWHRFIGLKKLINDSDEIIAISENTKNDLINIFSVPEKKIRVIYPGVSKCFKILPDAELEIIREKYKLPKKFIFNIGSLEPRKNIAGLVRVFDEIKADARFADYFLVLAGGGGWKNKEILSAITKAKNKDKIKVVGYIEDFDRVAFYNLADFFVYPSFYEGFGLPILEAMACGCPVLSGDSSSLPEVAGDAALLFDSSNENALKEAIIGLLNNDVLRKEMSLMGLENARRFSWEKSAVEYIEVFNLKKYD